MTPSSHSIRGLIIVGIFTLAFREASAQHSRLTVTPFVAAPGSVVRLTLVASPVRSDSIVAIRGEMAGEPLHFLNGDGAGVWRAIGGVPVDAADSVEARVVIERSSGVSDTSVAAVKIPRPPRSAVAPRRRPLSVAPRFTRPLDAETQARIDRENARARDVGHRAHSTQRLWTDSFLRPRSSEVTSRFGTGRMFNGRVASRHLGVDFGGGTGAPVRAANRGVVALVDDFFLAGKVVYVDHGGGVVTGYFHLSRALVSPGDTVERSQEIGLVGATGRVTGPHLHWSARYGKLTVNPMDLVGLGAGW